jgi:uncharacterized protein (DUF2147 family)
MRTASLVALMVCWGGGQALAADAKGDWVVADGTTVVRIDTCAEGLCGILALGKDPKGAWVKDLPGTDTNNPDPAKRSRPLSGLQIILGMKPAGADRWDGEIYNPQDGKTYSGHLILKSPDILRIEGCVLGFLCGGEDWTRAAAETRPPSAGAGQPRPTRPK